MFLLLIIKTGTAQDSIYQLLPIPIEINATRLDNFSVGKKTNHIDSIDLKNGQANNIAELLTQHSTVFIKSYGLSSLATPTFRGTGASHTAILWNGVNLQSSMNGVFDLSLLPVQFTDEVVVQSGGSSALFGSGAIGGTIHLNSKPTFQPKQFIASHTTIGSFNTFQQQLEFKTSDFRFFNHTKVFYHEATNDFPFINTTKINQPTERQTNAVIEQIGFQQENGFKLSNNQTINLRFWYQDNERQISPTLTEAQSVAFQEDKIYRLMADWKKIDKRITWSLKSAFFDETILFKDTLTGIDAHNHAQSWINEAESKVYLSENQLLNIGLNYTHYQATTDNYIGTPKENRLALFAAYRLSNKKWATNLNLRQERIANNWSPTTFSFGIERELSKQWQLRGQLSRNYRTPTFNDLYWQPNGNPNLLAESGWQQEIGIAFCPNWWQQTGHKIDVTVFNSLVNDWIQWLPINGLWQPDNLKQVWARGAEFDFKLKIPIGKQVLSLKGNYAFTQSTNQQIYNGSQNALDKQLIYTPIHQGTIQLSANIKKIYIGYQHQWTGKRFTTSDNNENSALPYYDIGQLTVSSGFNFYSFNINSQLKIQNIWNLSYQVIAWRPMPQRHFQLGVSIRFNQRKINKS